MPTGHAADARLGDALTMTGSSTLLTYALQTNPDPLQAGAAGASLTLVASNGGTRIVNCTQIMVTLPVGPNAKDLTADATGIQTQVPLGWGVSQLGGGFELTPDTPPTPIGKGGLEFKFYGLGVNDQPGTAVVTIDETASYPAQPVEVRAGTVAVPKFPPQFTVGDLMAEPTFVASGGTTMLIWSGTPSSATAPASYTISYNPGPGQINETVGNDGPYISEPLTQTSSVAFTLEVSITVPGQDAALVVQRQVTVQVDVPAPVIQQFSGKILSGTGEIQLRLDWAAQYADSVTITGFPTPFNPSDSWTVTPTAQAPLLTSYTLTAKNATGSAAATLTLAWGADGPPLPIGNAPGAVAVTPDGAYAFVANTGDNTVTVLDARALVVIGKPIQVGTTPGAIAVSPDGARVFVANMGDNTVTVLDAQSLTVVGAPTVGNAPGNIAVTPDGALVFVVSFNDNSVTVLDAQSLLVVGAPIRVGDVPTAVAFTPDAARAFVTTPENGMVTVLDVATLAVVGVPIPVGNHPQAIAVSPDGTRIFVTGSDAVTVLDARTDPPTVIGSRIPVGGQASAMAVTPDGALVFVVLNPRFVSGRVTVLNPQAWAVVGQPPIGKGSCSIAVSPDGTRAFVTNLDDDTVTVLVPSVTGGTGG